MHFKQQLFRKHVNQGQSHNDKSEPLTNKDVLTKRI